MFATLIVELDGSVCVQVCVCRCVWAGVCLTRCVGVAQSLIAALPGTSSRGH